MARIFTRPPISWFSLYSWFHVLHCFKSYFLENSGMIRWKQYVGEGRILCWKAKYFWRGHSCEFCWFVSWQKGKVQGSCFNRQVIFHTAFPPCSTKMCLLMANVGCNQVWAPTFNTPNLSNWHEIWIRKLRIVSTTKLICAISVKCAQPCSLPPHHHHDLAITIMVMIMIMEIMLIIMMSIIIMSRALRAFKFSPPLVFRPQLLQTEHPLQRSSK